MNIISNNCVGGFLYNIKKEKYKNPFIWMRVTGESLKHLILDYDKIDFTNYELTKDNKNKQSKVKKGYILYIITVCLILNSMIEDNIVLI